MWTKTRANKHCHRRQIYTRNTKNEKKKTIPNKIIIMVESDEWMEMNERTNERRSRQNGKQNNNNNTNKMRCMRMCESDGIKHDTRIKLQQFPNEKDWKYNDVEATKITYI